MQLRFLIVIAVLSTAGGCVLFLQPPPPGETCESDGDCAADERCLADVCVDDDRPALGNSCEDQCGQELDGCFCDVQCLQNGDCCSDFAFQCGGSDDAAQCAGRCGSPAPAGCFCDAECLDSQDCCPDYVDACTEVDTDGGVIDEDGGPVDVVDGGGNGPSDAGGGEGDAGPPPVTTVDFELTDYISIDASGAVVAPWPTEGTPPYLDIGPPGGGRIAFTFPSAGTFDVSVFANGELGDGIAPHVEFRVDGVVQFEHDVAATGFTDYAGVITVDAGPHNIDVVFVNDLFVAPGDDRNLLLGPLSLQGTLGSIGPTDAGTAPEDAGGGPSDAGSPSDAGGISDAGQPSGSDGGSGGGVPIIVGVGWQGVRMLSIDEGQSWCETGLMVDDHDDLFRGAGGHDGLIVGAHAGLANQGSFMVTTDGWNWEAIYATNEEDTLPPNPTGQWYANAVFGNGTWVAGGGCGNMATSADGRAWTSQGRQFDGCLHIRDLDFAEGVFVAAVQHEVDVDGGSETQYHWFESPSGLDGTWTLRELNADRVVNHIGDTFIGAENGDQVFRGRGICLVANGWADAAQIFRSTAADCSGRVVVGAPPHSIQAFVFSTTTAAALAPEGMPQALRDCLYP